MNTIIHKENKLAEGKILLNLLALLSLAILGTILFNTSNFTGFKNYFNNTSESTVLTTNKKNMLSPMAVNDVVTAALAFKASLTTTQQATLQQTYTTTLARHWSNLPCGSGCRNGIKFGDLTTAQLTAALAVIQAATGTETNNGYQEFLAVRAAEEALQTTAGGNNYDEGLYWISYLGTPSTTGAWMLQFGGHHYASNIAFNNGHVIGSTPYFMGVEPTTYTVNGTTYAPLEDERTGFRNMLASLTTAQFNTAKLTTTFSDCLMSPGESNGNTNTMPATKQGLICSGLTTTQQNLVIAAMQNYLNDMDAPTAASLLSLYTSELNSTYIAFTGSATVGSASTFLTSNTNYVRIDGPHVWIEFVCQTGVVFPSQIHYHTVWRDHISDYGVDLSGTSIDNLSTNSISFTSNLKIYPNPTTDLLNITTNNGFANASVYITDMSGRTVLKKHGISGQSATIDLFTLSNATYIVKIEDEGKVSSSKFIKK
jgi:hypothetical protein